MGCSKHFLCQEQITKKLTAVGAEPLNRNSWDFRRNASHLHWVNIISHHLKYKHRTLSTTFSQSVL